MIQEQDQTDIEMQKELDYIATLLEKRTFNDYCEYEFVVAALIDKHCPVCKNVIKDTDIGISILWADIRNYLKRVANIKFI